MASELRVLMLEDTPTDAELEEHELRKAGIEYTMIRVETRDAFIQALEEFHPDIILSDYNLPNFSGMAAIEIVQRSYSDIPVVMVTGALTDVEAVGLIHAGARDYVLKDRLARLAPAVQGALAAAHAARQNRESVKALYESEAKFRALVESSSDWIWEVDEQGTYIYSSPQVYDILGYTAQEIIGKTPFDLMPPAEAIRMRELFHVYITQMRGLHNVENVNLHKNGKPVYLETSGVPILNSKREIKGIRGIDRDITERKEVEAERINNAHTLERTLLQVIQAVAATVEARDPYTSGHEKRVADLASAIAGEMGLPQEKIQGLYLAATIHDLGKILLPSEILNRPGPLRPLEFELIKTHSHGGYDIIKDVQFPWPVAQMLLQHHERLDGSGYPQGLKGDGILSEARILAVADVVEAISSHRPYRPSLGITAALEEVERNRGKLYDCESVDACIRLFREKGYTFPT